jgi:hypothetical protein
MMNETKAMRSQILISSGEVLRATESAQKTTRLNLLDDIDATVDTLGRRARDFREMSSIISALVPSCINH